MDHGERMTYMSVRYLLCFLDHLKISKFNEYEAYSTITTFCKRLNSKNYE